MQSLIDSRPKSESSFRVARQARFGRAPRIQPMITRGAGTATRRTDIEKDFEALFTRMAHQQRFRGVRDAIKNLGDVTQRTCRSYATFSDSHGNQFAVVKPLSDGGLRVGVGDFLGIKELDLDTSSGLGSSSRVNFQFELESFEVLSGKHLSYLRQAFLACED